ncbi:MULTISPECIES: NAD-dependent succinate-semialdehyde dehydrogenase [Paraburkholderia]|uniref:Succinate semialdehyde dehydrogenase n=1 Tax=Paraburkholderia tropica TaxID=92647 RepID=A0AAQ1JUR8_9BURK|nr:MULTISPECIES: NAD-dependent succinate-semialdehyde dehydrogenase [Paraburkholderia]QNB12049.1 NAD-dependent succinate-semialdehyde dehydrogenase [Paraburkholderia tropica]RQM49821.1 NAD-dependent succinate-semialdehyde dehydrogenase [Paraburkholderia bannensis]RQN41063.1 NAD-dependent succinate-semialdehyde dehydrogenase [Paraburkholderia tropica]SEJ79026.1 succinate semialdehyde dehydrogenase [Paraburkholderia tropica]
MSQSASERLTQLKDPALFKTRAWIDGEWSGGGATFAVLDPADNGEIARVPDFGADEARRAVNAANAALPAWRAKTGKERAAVLRRWFDLVIEHADDLAAIMTAEQGKPLAEARGEVLYGASFLEWFAEEAKRVNGDVLASPASDRKLVVLKQPIGVCASITPWNFPIAMITRKVAPAIAAGCTIVVKPAEQTPLCALALAELAQRAGVPKGVFNVITADSANSIEVGKALCESDIVRHLSFTGSTPVGRILMQQCAPTVKKVALELGGHAPFIVFDDADLDAAVQGAVISKYRNAGQTCVCTNRFYVHDKVYDAFVDKLADASRKIKVGNGFEAGVSQGPLIDDDAVAKVAQHIDDATSKGAKLVAGGKVTEGRYVEPTVLADVTRDMLIAREETFGPVAAVFRFSEEAEVIALANDTEFGLASYFYSRDLGRVWRVAEALEYGMVGINTGLISNEVAPFGGVKQSGLGREGSKYGIDEYVELKYLCMGV